MYTINNMLKDACDFIFNIGDVIMMSWMTMIELKMR